MTGRRPPIDPRRDFARWADDVLLSEAEAGAVIGFSKHTVKSWRLEGRGRGPRATIVAGAVRYAVRDLHAWLNQHAARDAAE